jgi:CBS domain-containing protein
VTVKVEDAMTAEVLTMEPERTLRDAARFMTEHGIGAAVVIDPEAPGPGIITERDLVRSLGRGDNPDSEQKHKAPKLTSKAQQQGNQCQIRERKST